MKAQTILVVDDDPVFRSLMAKMLRVRGLQTQEAADGAAALQLFEGGRYAFSVIVSDINMPEMNGIEFLKRVRAKSQIPFIFFTGLSLVSESQQAFSLGANEFITKPIDKEGLQKIMALCHQAQRDEADAATRRELGPDDYREIKIEEFLSTNTLQSDVYIRLSATRFVKIAKKGEPSPRDRISDYRAKKIDSLFVLATDFNLYTKFAADLSAKAIATPGISVDAKLQVLQTATKLMVEACFLASEIDKASLETAQKVIENALKFASEHPQVMDQLLLLNSHSNRLYAHSVAVAFYSAVLARAHGWDSESTLTRVSLGGLFHDIGKKELDQALIYKSRKDLTREEILVLETHCARGRDILMTVKGLPEEVALIAMNHHENRTQTGFPRRLKGEQISAHVRLVHLVDKFCSLTNPIRPDEPQLSAVEAIERIHKHYEADVDPTFLSLLMEICKYDPKAAGKKRAS
jgi:putative nucleotidyltransferase with HDIG domain